jgi:hypothetical protein
MTTDNESRMNARKELLHNITLCPLAQLPPVTPHTGGFRNKRQTWYPGYKVMKNLSDLTRQSD